MKAYTYPLSRGRRIVSSCSLRGYVGERVYEVAIGDWRLLQWYETLPGYCHAAYRWDEVRHLFEGSESGA